jgi:hypothetical protein
MQHLTIGIDLDNTIICYDKTVYNTATSLGFIGKLHRKSKKMIRNTVRKLESGDEKWQEIQRSVYGEHMKDAGIYEGFRGFMRSSIKMGNRVYIVSHKTKYHTFASRSINQIQTALEFFKNNDLYTLVPRTNIFFEESRDKKIERIRRLKCDYFIDDLVEVLTDPSFPKKTARILFDPHKLSEKVDTLTIFHDWKRIHEYFVKKNR